MNNGAAAPPRRYGIITHPISPAVLLLPEHDRWSLPYLAPEKHFFAMAEPINRGLRAQLGLTLSVLNWVYRHPAPLNVVADRVYALECHSPLSTLPPHARWATASDLADLPLAVPEHRAVLQRWLADTAAGKLPQTPWARKGWFNEAVDWAHSQARQAGIALIGEVEQIKTWQVSCLLRLPAQDGDLYLKAAPAFAPVEPELTQALAVRYPHLMPSIIAIEPERHWLLMRDFCGTPLADVPDIARWEEALQTYARIQIESLTDPRFILDAGGQDRRIPILRAQMERMLNDHAALQARGVLTAEQVAALQALLPELHSLCTELESGCVPPTLDHGDLHPRNIACNDERLIFFDWSDSCLSHPFFSLCPFMEMVEKNHLLQDVPSRLERLRDAYLAPWAAFGSRTALLRLYEAAQRLGHVHCALSYYAYILPMIEQKEEWDVVASDWLSRLLPDSEKQG